MNLRPFAPRVLFAVALASSAHPQTPMDRLPKDKAGEAVKRAIDYAGTFTPWAETRTLSFKKTTIRYTPKGAEESRRVERHSYALKPQLRARIEREEGGKRITLINTGSEFAMLTDGRAATSQEETNQARNATFGSHYVFNMPFKLTDDGVTLSHKGEVKLRDGSLADAVQVTYGKGVGDSGGLHDWTYYFDVKTGRLSANLLGYDGGRFEYTEYLDDQPLGKLRLSTRRNGYNADAKGAKGPRKSEIIYEEIQIDSPLGDDLFRLSK